MFVQKKLEDFKNLQHLVLKHVGTVFVLNPTMRKLLLDFIHIFTAHSKYYDFKIHKK